MKNVRRSLIRFSLLPAAVVLGGLGFMGWNARQHAQAQALWKAEAESHGAIVMQAGYGGGRLARIPIIGRFAIHTQTEIMLPDTAAAGRCLELLKTNPDLARIWIHKTDVDEAMVEQIRKARPGLDTIRYTR